jgi:hypothetical protein
MMRLLKGPELAILVYSAIKALAEAVCEDEESESPASIGFSFTAREEVA